MSTMEEASNEKRNELDDTGEGGKGETMTEQAVEEGDEDVGEEEQVDDSQQELKKQSPPVRPKVSVSFHWLSDDYLFRGVEDYLAKSSAS